jgi:hypothetical protein
MLEGRFPRQVSVSRLCSHLRTVQTAESSGTLRLSLYRFRGNSGSYWRAKYSANSATTSQSQADTTCAGPAALHKVSAQRTELPRHTW